MGHNPVLLEIPPPLMTSEPGSFARHTVVERKPQIIDSVMADNDYPPQAVAALEALRDEIERGQVRLLAEQADDVAFWNRQAAAYQDRAWLELPWYWAETYFYRRLLEAVGYFSPGPQRGHDPFAVAKRAQEQAPVAAWLAHSGQLDGLDPTELFHVLLHSSLWGNRTDLSNLHVRQGPTAGTDTAHERHNLLVDHTEQVTARLSSGVGQVDFVNDNAGPELLHDLILADFLLGAGWAGGVTFHLKAQPFFVSDAMVADVWTLLALLAGEPLGRRLAAHLATRRLVLTGDPFWTTCLMFRHLPPALTASLARSDLVILKGDVNYRRLLDDAHWPHSARLETIAGYFPAPMVTLRTLKSEIMVGLAPGQAEALAAEDPTWLINGQRGLVHWADKGTTHPRPATGRADRLAPAAGQ